MASSNYDTERSDVDEGGMTYDAVWCDSARESRTEKIAKYLLKILDNWNSNFDPQIRIFAKICLVSLYLKQHRHYQNNIHPTIIYSSSTFVLLFECWRYSFSLHTYNVFIWWTGINYLSRRRLVDWGWGVAIREHRMLK